MVSASGKLADYHPALTDKAAHVQLVGRSCPSNGRGADRQPHLRRRRDFHLAERRATEGGVILRSCRPNCSQTQGVDRHDLAVGCLRYIPLLDIDELVAGAGRSRRVRPLADHRYQTLRPCIVVEGGSATPRTSTKLRELRSQRQGAGGARGLRGQRRLPGAAQLSDVGEPDAESIPIARGHEGSVPMTPNCRSCSAASIRSTGGSGRLCRVACPATLIKHLTDLIDGRIPPEQSDAALRLRGRPHVLTSNRQHQKLKGSRSIRSPGSRVTAR